jgi:dihydroorotate dehydrogenase
MKHIFRSIVLYILSAVYHFLIRPLIFLTSAQKAHERAVGLMSGMDSSPLAQSVMKTTYRILQIERGDCVGGVKFRHPLVLAAGFVKGIGFDSEEKALEAVRRGENIIPGWRTMPSLVGPVEFGSFTRWPRLGNSGTVIWRDTKSQSTQNRVGLRNPGSTAAAEFLCRHRKFLPLIYGVNIAVSPGVTNLEQERCEVLESIDAFLERGVYPKWFTLNLSCPNTQDDPTANQTEAKARDLCSTVVNHIREKAPKEIPLWVKISPDLADEQYQVLMDAFADTGIRAVIATNTLAMPSPPDPRVMAGVGGGQLHSRALEAASRLMQVKREGSYNVDVIGCGGVLDGKTYRNFRSLGIPVVQYYSALVYRGPLAAAIIMNEA